MREQSNLCPQCSRGRPRWLKMRSRNRVAQGSQAGRGGAPDLPALSKSNGPAGTRRTGRTSNSIACSVCRIHTDTDRCDRAFRKAPHRPCTMRMPVLTRVSDGKDFRRLDVGSKGRAIFRFDAAGHGSLHHFSYGCEHVAECVLSHNMFCLLVQGGGRSSFSAEQFSQIVLGDGVFWGRVEWPSGKPVQPRLCGLGRRRGQCPDCSGRTRIRDPYFAWCLLMSSVTAPARCHALNNNRPHKPTSPLMSKRSGNSHNYLKYFRLQ